MGEADSMGSMGSAEESYDEDEDEDETEEENESDAPEPLAAKVSDPRSHVQMQDVATQTYVPVGEENITLRPPCLDSKDFNMPQNDISSGSLASMHNNVHVPPVSMQSQDQALANQHSAAITTAMDDMALTQLDMDVQNDGHPLSADCTFHGGKPADSQPRRFVQKYSFMIRPGVLKDSKPKSEKVSSVKI